MPRKVILGTVIFCAICFTIPALAADKQRVCYKLISGKGSVMCQRFEQNLNRFCADEPMVCERKIHPEFEKYFSFPQWESVDPEKHLDIIADYIRARAPSYACIGDQCQSEWREKKWQDYKVGLQERLKAGQVTLSRSKINIFAKSRLVYRLVDKPCSPKDPDYWDSPRVPILIAVDENTGKFQSDFTAILGAGGPYDVLLYNGKTYLTVWGGDFPVRGNLAIESKPEINCMFKYVGNKGARK